MEVELLNNQDLHIPDVWKNEYAHSNYKQDDFYKQRFDEAFAHSIPLHNRQVLVDVLLQQYADYQTENYASLIQKLTQENTFTVCTGHQLCLFGGPLFFLYKIAGIINLAKQLNQQFPDKKVVPIFWMASEDHDFDEINYIYLFGKKYEWSTPSVGAVGRLSTTGIDDLLAQLEEVKGTLPFADECLHFLKTSYQLRNLSEATRALVHHLFKNYDLLCLDADDAQLKSLFKPYLEKEINEQFSFHAVENRNKVLAEKGYPLQVSPREINLFYLENHSRLRIIANEDQFSIDQSSKTWTKEQLLQELSASPEKFSPNVVLRPLYQQCILPNLAYVGGPGEITYWMQLTQVFSSANIPFPVLIPRNSFLILDEITQKKMMKANLSDSDLFKDALQLEREFLETNVAEEISLETNKGEVAQVFEHLRQHILNVDAGLETQVLAEEKKLLNFLSNLEAKLRRSEKQKHEQSIAAIHAIKDRVFPNGIPQERYEASIGFYWKYGAEGIAFIVKHANPLNSNYQLVRV